MQKNVSASRLKPKTLPPIRPNVGLEAVYRKRLQKLLEEMHCSVQYWLQVRYGQHEDALALDASPVAELRAEIRKLARRWQKRFNDLAPKLAKYFASSASKRTDAQMKKLLADAGMTVDFKLTRQQQNVLKAAVAANVQLIKSIPQRYMGKVEQSVMKAVQAGGKLGDLTKELQQSFGVEKRRAALIARDQNRKATAALQRQRQIEVGITEAIWLHSYGGKVPRKTHLANDGKRFDVVNGWYDPAEKKRIWPGTLINCRCVQRAVIPGYMVVNKPDQTTLQIKREAEKRAR